MRKMLFKVVFSAITAAAISISAYFSLLPQTPPRDAGECFSKISDLQAAIRSKNHCTEVISQKDQHLERALQYRAGAYTFLGEYENAKADILSALGIISDDMKILNLHVALVGIEAQLDNYQAVTDLTVDLLIQRPTDDKLIYELIGHILGAKDQTLLRRVGRDISQHAKLRAASVIFSLHEAWDRMSREETASFLKSQIEAHPIDDPLGMMTLHRALLLFCADNPGQCPLLSAREEVLRHLKEEVTCQSLSEISSTPNSFPDGLRLPNGVDFTSDSTKATNLHFKLIKEFMENPSETTALQVLSLTLLIECKVKIGTVENSGNKSEIGKNELENWILSSEHKNTVAIASYFLKTN